MDKLSDISRFQEQHNIVLQGFDPISAGGFTQIPNYLLNNKGLTNNAKVVYAKLLSYAWHNNHVFPGQERMAEEIGSSKSTVGRAVQELEEQGWLEIQRRGQGKTNLYVLKYFRMSEWAPPVCPLRARRPCMDEMEEYRRLQYAPHARGGPAPEAPRAGSSLPPWDRPPGHSACGQSCGA